MLEYSNGTYCIQWDSIFDANKIVSATLADKVATELILVTSTD